jgi:hypothetical protein
MAVGDHSQLNRFNPRNAGIAAMSNKLQHQQTVSRVAKAQQRRKLPRTQVDFQQQIQAKK